MRFSLITTLAFVAVAMGQGVPNVLHPNTATNKCLDVRGDVRANGTAVQIFDCNGSPAQLWLLNLGSTTVQLANSTFCLDAGRAPVISGTLMKIWQCIEDLPAQSWFLTTDARIALEDRGLCLDLPSGDTTNTNQVQVWQCTNGNTNQIWSN